MSLLDDDLIDKPFGKAHHFYSLERFYTTPLNKAYANNNAYAEELKNYKFKNVRPYYNKNEWDICTIYFGKNKNTLKNKFVIEDYFVSNTTICNILLNRIMNCPMEYFNDPILLQNYLQFPCTKITIVNDPLNIVNITFWKKGKVLAYLQFISN